MDKLSIVLDILSKGRIFIINSTEMLIINKELINTYILTYPNAKKYLTAFSKTVSDATWKTPHDVKLTYPKASILGNRLYVFDIHANHYRLLAEINFQFLKMELKWFGTHAEYDQLKL